MHVSRAGFIEALLYGFAGEFGTIAVAAKMTEVDMFELGRNQFGEDIRGGIVREVAVPTQDALLNAPRAARVVLEQFMS